MQIESPANSYAQAAVHGALMSGHQATTSWDMSNLPSIDAMKAKRGSIPNLNFALERATL